MQVGFDPLLLVMLVFAIVLWASPEVQTTLPMTNLHSNCLILIACLVPVTRQRTVPGQHELVVKACRVIETELPSENVAVECAVAKGPAP